MNGDYIRQPEANRTIQYICGDCYIDDLVMHREDSDLDGVFDSSYYHLTDVQLSSLAIINEAATLLERITYTPYGQARHHWPGDIDGDWAVTQTEDLDVIRGLWGTNSGNPGYRSECDLNRDGLIAKADSILAGGVAAALSGGQISSSTIDSQMGFDGGLYNDESDQYAMRNRCYDPWLGRFLERDPTGYADGMNLYESMMSSPMVYLDPMGTDSYESMLSQQALTNSNILSLARSGDIPVALASAMINESGALTRARISTEWSLRELAKTSAGAKAVVNAAVDTLLSFSSLGYVNHAEFLNVSDQERAVGYGLSYGAARLSSELGFGLMTGSASLAGKSGMGIMAFDALGNLVMTGEGIYDMANCGLSWGNSAQVGFGLFGLGGNLSGKLWADHALELGFDPTKQKYNAFESRAGRILEKQVGRLHRDPTGAAEFFDKHGNSYDAIGGVPRGIANTGEFINSLNKHLNKSVDYIPVDLRGFSRSQRRDINNYIDNLPTEKLLKIIKLW